MSPIEGSMKSKDGLTESKGVFFPQTYDPTTYSVINRSVLESSNFYPQYDGTLANGAEALYKFSKFQDKIQNIGRVCIGIDDQKVPTPTIYPASHRGVTAISGGFVTVLNDASGLRVQYTKVNADGTFTYGAVATIDAAAASAGNAAVIQDDANNVVIVYKNTNGAGTWYVRMVRVTVDLGTLVCTGTPVTVDSHASSAGSGNHEVVKVTGSLYCIAVSRESTARNFYMVNGSFVSIGTITNTTYTFPVGIMSDGVSSAFFAYGSTSYAKITNTGGVPTITTLAGNTYYTTWNGFILDYASTSIRRIRTSDMTVVSSVVLSGTNIATSFKVQYGMNNLPSDQINNIVHTINNNYSGVGSVGSYGITKNSFDTITPGIPLNTVYGSTFQVMVSDDGATIVVIPYREFEVYVDGVKVLNSVLCHNGAVHDLNVAITENSDIVLKNVSGYSTKAYILSAYCNVK